MDRVSKLGKSKSKNKRRRKIFFGISLTGLTTLIGLTAFFGNQLSTNSTVTSTSNVADNQAAALPSLNSLQEYWKNLNSDTLVDKSTSLSKFVNQNGAIFQNLISSEKYASTASLNQLVSTSRQIDMNSEEANKRILKTNFQTQVRGVADSFYNWGTEAVEDADEFIARVNSLKNMYPNFRDNFVQNYGQNVGVWTNPDELTSKSFQADLPDVGENQQRYMDTVFLRTNYRDLIANKAEGAYAAYLENNMLASAAAQSAAQGTFSGGVFNNPAYQSPDFGWSSIIQNTLHSNTEFLTAASMYFNNDAQTRALVKQVESIGHSAAAQHRDRRKQYETWTATFASCAIASAPGLILGAAIWCIPILITASAMLAILSPKSNPIKLPIQVYNDWAKNDNLKFENIIDRANYPSLGRDANGVLKYDDQTTRIWANLPTGSPVSAQLWKNSLTSTFSDSRDNTVALDYKTLADQTRSLADNLGNLANRQNGRSQAKADIQALSNVYFDKLAKEWNEEAELIKGGNEKIYFDNILSTGTDSIKDFMDGDMYDGLWNVAMNGYLKELSSQVKQTFDSYTSARTPDGASSLTRYHNSKSDSAINNFFKVSKTLSEENKVRIFKRQLDKAWAQNKTQFEQRMNTKLEASKKDAAVEFEKVRTTLQTYLKTPFTETNFQIANVATDSLNQKSIPPGTAENPTVFSLIPSGNPGISFKGSDARAEDVLDSFLTKNILYRSWLEKDSPVAGLLGERSIVFQQQFLNSVLTEARRSLLTSPSMTNIFTKFNTQTTDLWNGFLASTSQIRNRKLSPNEVNEFYLENVVSRIKIYESILTAEIKSVSLANGFLLDILEVPRVNDNTNGYQTIWEMMDDDTSENAVALRTYINNISTSLLTGGGVGA